jgi:hypothetical protein
MLSTINHQTLQNLEIVWKLGFKLKITVVFCWKLHIVGVPFYPSKVDAPSHSLKDSMNLKMKTTKKKVGVHSLARNILGVEGHARTPGWGLRWVTSGSIIHTNLHISNKLVSAWLEHFWCIDKPRAYTDSQNSPQLELEGSHELPPYSNFYY